MMQENHVFEDSGGQPRRNRDPRLPRRLRAGRQDCRRFSHRGPELDPPPEGRRGVSDRRGRPSRSGHTSTSTKSCAWPRNPGRTPSTPATASSPRTRAWRVPPRPPASPSSARRRKSWNWPATRWRPWRRPARPVFPCSSPASRRRTSTSSSPPPTKSASPSSPRPWPAAAAAACAGWTPGRRCPKPCRPPCARRTRRSVTPPCSWSRPSCAPATSRSRSWPMPRATSCTSSSATVPSSAATRRSSRSPRRRTWTRASGRRSTAMP